MNRKGWRPAWFLSVLLALSIAFAATQVCRVKALENQVGAEYQRAFYETVELVEGMESDLEKLMVTASGAQEQKLLGEITRQAQSMQVNLSSLPADLPVVSGSIKFANQVGDFCRTLDNRLSAGGAIGEADGETLSALLSACAELKAQLNEMAAGLNTGAQVLTRRVDAVSLNDTQPAESLVTFPTLLYDGPFSDGRDTDGLIALDDTPCDSAEALEKAKSFIGEDRVSRAFLTGEGETPVPVWEITCFTDDGILVLAVTKQGGAVVYMLCESGVERAQYTAAGAIDLAQIFLKQQGFGLMEVSYWLADEGRVIVNFAARQDGVILYPDLIKVQMSLATGRVIGFEALNYLSSHRTREDLTPELTEAQARERLSPHLTCDKARLCVIPLETGEALCYECHTRLGEAEFLIYIDARTGDERQIYKVISDEGGTLVV